MIEKNTTPILDTRRFLFESTNGRRAYTKTLAEKEQPLDQLPSHERRQVHQLALGRGALEKASLIEETGGSGLEANLFKLTGHIHSFFNATGELNTIRDIYKGNIKHMDPETRREYHDAKKGVIQFNHILRDVIQTGANKLKYSELLHFVKTMYAHTGGRETGTFDYEINSTMEGIRNEIGFEQLVIALGIEYEPSDDVRSETLGIDGRLDGDVPIDTKAGLIETRNAKRKAVEQGRNPDLIIYSHINNRDYEDGLMLPYDKVESTAQKVKPDVLNAIASYRRKQRVA